MSLSPDDVANKRFTTVRFKEGYDEEEVDGFLDVVEAELRRLLSDNSSLKAEATGAPAAPAVTPAAVPVPPADGPEPDAGSAAGPGAADTDDPDEAAPATATEAAEPSGDAEETSGRALRTLLLAQRTADEAVAQAKAEAASILATARSKAETMDREATVRQAESLSRLTEQRRELEVAIETLRVFEQAHRSRLTNYLQDQLQDLQRARTMPPMPTVATTTGSAASGGIGSGAQMPSPTGEPPSAAPGATTTASTTRAWSTPGSGVVTDVDGSSDPRLRTTSFSDGDIDHRPGFPTS